MLHYLLFPLGILAMLWAGTTLLYGLTLAITGICQRVVYRRVKDKHRKTCSAHGPRVTLGCNTEIRLLTNTKVAKFMNWLLYNKWISYWPVSLVLVSIDSVRDFFTINARNDASTKLKEMADRALLEAKWERIDSLHWLFQATGEDNQVFRYREVLAKMIGHGLYMVCYATYTDLPRQSLGNHIVLDGDQFIGDQDWALKVIQQIVEGNFPSVIGFGSNISAHYFTEDHNQINTVDNDTRMHDYTHVGVVKIGTDGWRGTLAIAFRTQAYNDSPTLWRLMYFCGHKGYPLLVGTNDVVAAATAATEAIRHDMQPRHGAWEGIFTY